MKPIFKALNIFFSLCLTFSLLTLNSAPGAQPDPRHKAATSSVVVNYAKNLLNTIVDSNFRGSWVIDPDNWDKESEIKQKAKKSFDSLAKVKIGYTQRQVKEILKSPTEIRNNGKIWIYGSLGEDGTYQGLLEVFFDEKRESVIGIITFNNKDLSENIEINIGDSIDKMISVYGEPVDEKDFIEDPDNKNYLGLYYLYPRSSIGFLIGQDKATKNLLVHGVLIFGKS